MAGLTNTGILDVRHLSGWVQEVQTLEGGGTRLIVRVATKQGDAYEVHNVPKSRVREIGAAVEAVEAVQGTDEDPERSVGEVVSAILREYEDADNISEEVAEGEPSSF